MKMKTYQCNNQKYDCDQCDKSYKEKNYLKQHIIATHLGISYLCDICNSKFISRKGLQAHISRKHSENVPKQKCPKCPFETLQKADINRHFKNKHTSFKPIFSRKPMKESCKTCDKSFVSKLSLKNHINSIHIGLAEQCNICNKVVKQLKIHIRLKHSNSDENVNMRIVNIQLSKKDNKRYTTKEFI